MKKILNQLATLFLFIELLMMIWWHVRLVCYLFFLLISKQISVAFIELCISQRSIDSHV